MGKILIGGLAAACLVPIAFIGWFAWNTFDIPPLNMPGVAVSVPSPDGEAVAFVRNHFEIDGPNQSLWLRDDRGTTKLRHLGPDSQSCNEIVWSADGSTVLFLVNGAYGVVADRARAEIVIQAWLVEDHRDVPPAERASDLSLSADGFAGASARLPATLRGLRSDHGARGSVLGNG